MKKASYKYPFRVSTDMEYIDEEYYTYACTACHNTLYRDQNPEDHVRETGHREFIVTPYVRRMYKKDENM